jgi:thioredoxin reductase (NADPH)
MEKTHDIVVIGAGIAGLSASVAAARLGRQTLLVTGHALGGHLISIESVEGFPGFPEVVPGYELCPTVQTQAADAGAEFAMSEVSSLEREQDGWRVRSASGDFLAKAVIVASGTVLKSLGVPGEDELRGKGVSQCASCDAPLLVGQEAVVIGGGDSAMQEALTLAEHTSRVTLLHRGEALAGQAAFRRRIEAAHNVVTRFAVTVSEILGDDAVSGVRIRDGESGEEDELPAQGVFVFVGLHGNAGFLGNLVSRDTGGRIHTDVALRTAAPGLFAAGTVRSGAAGRAVAAAGEGAQAAIGADAFLASGGWPSQ